jgi:AraC-like DNA-binding protein
MDVLSDWLRTLDTRGVLLARSRLIAPWGMSIAASKDCTFHLLTQGKCWLRRGKETPLEMRAGDLVLLRDGEAHDLVHTPKAIAEPLERILARPEQRGSGPQATLICGAYRSGGPQQLPLIRSMPPVLHFRATEIANDAALSALVKLLLEEVEQPGPGAETLLPTLFDALLLYLLRLWGRQQCSQNRWLAGLQDPALSLALQQIHSAPEADWTVEGLAQTAGLSRAVFAKRFSEAFGEAPLTYLTNWRMQLAAKRFATGAASLVEVAAQLGYQSEFSFSRAFKRRWGVAPSIYRRKAQQTGAKN